MTQEITGPKCKVREKEKMARRHRRTKQKHKTLVAYDLVSNHYGSL